MTKNVFYTDAQLKEEISKCEYCAEKPCMHACPCHCSPADFIMAAAKGQPSDIKRAALPVLRHRVQLTPEVAISGQETDDVLLAIIAGVPAPRG